MVNYIALLVSLLISAVSGYYSIIGLTAIFSASFYPVIMMGTVLEAGKLVTASWLYHNWNNVSRVLKYYLTAMVLLLMFINALGVFGFLSRAHIQQTVDINTGQADKLQIIKQQIDFQNQSINDIDKQILQIDNALAKLTEKGQASSSLRAAEQQKKNRDNLIKRKDEYVKNISKYSEERIKIESSIKRLEAEVGPLKYVAELVYGSDDKDQLEKAVRLVIILLVIVFDPLAVVLLIAANVGLSMKKELTFVVENDSILYIDDNVLEGELNVVKRETY